MLKILVCIEVFLAFQGKKSYKQHIIKNADSTENRYTVCEDCQRDMKQEGRKYKTRENF